MGEMKDDVQATQKECVVTWHKHCSGQPRASLHRRSLKFLYNTFRKEEVKVRVHSAVKSQARQTWIQAWTLPFTAAPWPAY